MPRDGPGPNPNHVIDRFATTVTVYPNLGVDWRSDSVYGDDAFGDPFEARMTIRPADALPFSIADLGQTDEGGERQIADVPASVAESVAVDDSVDYDDRAWRVTERQYANRHGFVRYRLIPEDRRSYGKRS